MCRLSPASQPPSSHPRGPTSRRKLPSGVVSLWASVWQPCVLGFCRSASHLASMSGPLQAHISKSGLIVPSQEGFDIFTMILTHQVSYCAHTHHLRGRSFKKAFILAGFQLHTDGSQADKTPPGHPHESPAETGQLPWLDVSVHHLPLVPCGSPVCESLIVLRS